MADDLYRQTFKAVEVHFKKMALQRNMVQVENEIYWRLIDQQKIQKGSCPLLYRKRNLDEETDSTWVQLFHAPYCRCPRCPMYSDDYFRDCRRTSPFAGLEIDPAYAYESVDFGGSIHPDKHMLFCRCRRCKKTSQYHMIKASKRVLRAELKKSPFSGVAMLNAENIPVLRNYKESVIDNAVQTIIHTPPHKKYVSRPRVNQ